MIGYGFVGDPMDGRVDMGDKGLNDSRLEILLYYMDERNRNPDHPEDVIEQLINLNQLRVRWVAWRQDSLKTTLRGRMYLYIHGYDVELPSMNYGLFIPDDDEVES